MKKFTGFFNPISIKINWKDCFMRSFKIYLFLLLYSSQSFAQVVLPPANIDCPSKDLDVTSAILPAPTNDPCNCTGTRTLQLGIINKTGSDRTAFAMWGKLIRRDASGNPIGNPEPIFACASGILASTTKFYTTSTTVTVDCNQSLEIVDVILAWTSANKKENCDFLKNNPSTINPKCGRSDIIRVETGVEAVFDVNSATCTADGTIKVSPFGGIAPYKVKIGNDERTGIPAGGSETFSLPAGTYSILLTDGRPCSATRSRTIGSSSAPSVSAGTAFTKTCVTNTSGRQIGEEPVTGFSYSWSSNPTGFSSNSSNPTVNPLVTTVYSVRKTNTTTGCYADASVTVTVDNATPSVSAGSPFTKTCVTNTSGRQIGEASVSGFTYSWTPSIGLSADNISNPTANPTVTTTYTVTKTNTNTGCSASNEVMVTVDNTIPTLTLSASPVSINTSITTTSQLGIASISPGVISDYDYSWEISSKPSGSNASLTDPLTTTPVLNILAPYSPGSYVVQVTATHKITGCSNTKSITVPVPVPGTLPCSVDGASLVCPGTTNTYNGPSPIPDGYSYTWTVTGDGTVVGATNGTSVQVQASSSCNSTYTVKLHIQSSSAVIFTDCEQTVTVKDDIIPVLATAPSAVTVQCLADVPAMTSLTWTDNCSAGGSVTGVDGPLVGGACGGTITRTWNVSDACGNAAVTRTQIITVNDNIPPTINFCPADIVVDCDASILPANTGGAATATDNCSSITPAYEDDITPIGSCFTKLITRTWTATDACGNSVTCVQRITVRDRTAPVITCNNDGTASATDNCSATVQLYFSNGMWTAIDESGNVSTHAACPVINGNQQTSAVTEQTNRVAINIQTVQDPLAKELKVQAYPNPFSSKVKFMISSPVKGRGTLEVYNATGQKIRTVHTDFMVAGIQTVELNFAVTHVTNLVYVLRIGDKQVTGKLLQINR